MKHGLIKILIIDDNPEDRELYRRLLQGTQQNNEQKYKLLEAELGEEGINIFHSEHPNCVLLDYSLPDITGIEVLEQLNNNEEKEPNPVIMLTGQGNESIAVEAMKNGAQDYLVKGKVNSTNLNRAISNVIEKVDLLQQIHKKDILYSNLINNSLGIIYTHDLKGRILSINPAAANSLGYKVDELINKNLSDIILPIEKEFLTGYLERIQQNSIDKGIIHVVTKDGEERTWMYRNTLYKDKETEHIFYVIGHAQDISERERAERATHASLHEKEVLLQEIHHRVKNNLQVISSLLQLQSRYIHDEEALRLFKESQDRIKCMALIHEKLYQSHNLTEIDFGEYLRSLMVILVHAYSTQSKIIKTVINAEAVKLSVETAVPLGLIVNELVTNSLKYAFSSQQSGQITISLAPISSTELSLSVSDDGIGLPLNFTLDNQKAFGMRLVQYMVEQLHGQLEIQQENGTKFMLNFNPFYGKLSESKTTNK